MTKAQALAESCNVFKHHYDTQQVKTAAALGQRSGDVFLVFYAAMLQGDIERGHDIQALKMISDMTARCRQIGALG